VSPAYYYNKGINEALLPEGGVFTYPDGQAKPAIEGVFSGISIIWITDYPITKRR